jgi:hypothetical protein
MKGKLNDMLVILFALQHNTISLCTKNYGGVVSFLSIIKVCLKI